MARKSDVGAIKGGATGNTQQGYVDAGKGGAEEGESDPSGYNLGVEQENKRAEERAKKAAEAAKRMKKRSRFGNFLGKLSSTLGIGAAAVSWIPVVGQITGAILGGASVATGVAAQYQKTKAYNAYAKEMGLKQQKFNPLGSILIGAGTTALGVMSGGAASSILGTVGRGIGTASSIMGHAADLNAANGGNEETTGKMKAASMIGGLASGAVGAVDNQLVSRQMISGDTVNIPQWKLPISDNAARVARGAAGAAISTGNILNSYDELRNGTNDPINSKWNMVTSGLAGVGNVGQMIDSEGLTNTMGLASAASDTAANLRSGIVNEDPMSYMRAARAAGNIPKMFSMSSLLGGVPEALTTTQEVDDGVEVVKTATGYGVEGSEEVFDTKEEAEEFAKTRAARGNASGEGEAPEAEGAAAEGSVVPTASGGAVPEAAPAEAAAPEAEAVAHEGAQAAGTPEGEVPEGEETLETPAAAEAAEPERAGEVAAARAEPLDIDVQDLVTKYAGKGGWLARYLADESVPQEQRDFVKENYKSVANTREEEYEIAKARTDEKRTGRKMANEAERLDAVKQNQQIKAHNALVDEYAELKKSPFLNFIAINEFERVHPEFRSIMTATGDVTRAGGKAGTVNPGMEFSERNPGKKELIPVPEPVYEDIMEKVEIPREMGTRTIATYGKLSMPAPPPVVEEAPPPPVVEEAPPPPVVEEAPPPPVVEEAPPPPVVEEAPPPPEVYEYEHTERKARKRTEEDTIEKDRQKQGSAEMTQGSAQYAGEEEPDVPDFNDEVLLTDKKKAWNYKGLDMGNDRNVIGYTGEKENLGKYWQEEGDEEEDEEGEGKTVDWINNSYYDVLSDIRTKKINAGFLDRISRILKVS